MSVSKVSYTRASAVVASDDAPIFNPALFIFQSTSNATTSSFELVANENIENFGIRAGDIVVNTTTNRSAIATSEPYAGNLLPLNADIFTVGSEGYAIYQGAQNSASQSGCVLYVAQNGDFRCITLGGDEVTFLGVVAGTILPIQVKQVLLTGYNSLLVALW